MNIHDLFCAKIVALSDIAVETKKFSFEILDSHRSFSPGQFFLLCADEKTARAYSIASDPKKLPFFDLLIKKVPNGAVTENFLWKKKEGEIINFRGPLGRFGISSESKHSIFVATGTGLSPFRSLWESLSHQENPPRITLFFGVRSEQFLFCTEEIKEMEQKNPHFSATICLSRPEKDGDFFTGRVTDAIRKKPSAFFEKSEISLCGSKDMVKEIKEILTEKNFSGKMNEESW